MNQVQNCVQIINQQIKNFKPDVGLILGSGLGQFCDNINPKASLNFEDLPGFPVAGVGGHAGKLLFGEIQGTNVVVMQGRAHYYEHGKADIMAVAIEVLNAIGCKSLVLTNAAGSTLEESPPGSVMLITDHINMTGISPLFGADGNERFVNMVNAYDPKLNNDMREAAKANNINLHEGVYAWFSGPQFETPAEIRAVTILGADAVGMSTVPEVIVANHCSLPTIAISIITNYAAGLSNTPLSHKETLEQAALAENNILSASSFLSL